jgi:sortase A
MTDIFYRLEVQNKYEDFEVRVSNGKISKNTSSKQAQTSDVNNQSNTNNQSEKNQGKSSTEEQTLWRNDAIISQEKIEDLYQKLVKENESLFKNGQSTLQDPFSYQNSDVDLSQYGLKDNLIAFIEIPKIDVKLPLYLGANTYNMKLGAVHLTNTSYPIGGNNTNSVIAAHRGYSRTAMFRNLDRLKTGDRVYIENFRETLAYRVENCEVILPTDVSKLLIEEDEDMITLITCHPYRKSTHRLAIFCKRVYVDDLGSLNEASNDSQTNAIVGSTTEKNTSNTEGSAFKISGILSVMSEQKTLWQKIKFILSIILLIVFLIGIVYSVIVLAKRGNEMTHNRDYSRQSNILTNEEKQNWKNKSVDEGKAYMELNSKVPVSEKMATIRLINPPYSDFIIEVEYKLKDNGQILYKTEKLNPGTIVNTAYFDCNLQKGIYNATAEYKFYDGTMKLQATQTKDIEIEIK